MIPKFLNQTKLGSLKMRMVFSHFPKKWWGQDGIYSAQYPHTYTVVWLLLWWHRKYCYKRILPLLPLTLDYLFKLYKEFNSWAIQCFKYLIIFPFSWMSQPSSQISKNMVAYVNYSAIRDDKGENKGGFLYKRSNSSSHFFLSLHFKRLGTQCSPPTF